MNPTDLYKQPQIQAVQAGAKPVNRKKSCVQSFIYIGCLICLFAAAQLIPEVYQDFYLSLFMILFILSIIILNFKAMALIYLKTPIQFQNDFQELLIEGKEPLILKDADRITFLYMGDGKKGHLFSNLLVRKLSIDDSHNRFFVDHLKINHDEIFFQIKSQEDKVNYFNFINQMHYFNPLTKLIVGRDEIPLPVDPNQVFLVNENRQLLK